jgi:hypothetical protein
MSLPLPSQRSQRNRSHRRQPPLPGPGLLHHLAAVIGLASRRGTGEAPLAAPMRRRRQRLALAQRLLDPLPAALRAPGSDGERFWQALRWGGIGMLIAWWLGR